MKIIAEPAEDRVLILTRLLDAPRRLVFQAWAQPGHLARWWGPNGFTLPVCTQDFRPGGAYRFCMRAPDGTDHWVWGTYREIVEPERLVFTWQRNDEAGLRRQLNNVVTVTLVAQGGKTHLTLHHAAFQTVADRDDHRGGWSECLDRLGQHAFEQVASRREIS
ncbi:MAG: polyketide cyclase [Lacunisphaera sp.]|nr:polyketide cyclase [Lacunisphaera sp.]MDB6165653.1 polyketide cyclase [Lacunisphaera sp.]